MKDRPYKKSIQNIDPSESTDGYGRNIPSNEQVRPHVVENGARLIAQPGYPPKKVINRLAELFAAAMIAERN